MSTFIQQLLRVTHSVHFGNLLQSALDDERYEDAALIKAEVDARVQKGFMKYVDVDGERVAVPITMPPFTG